MDWTGVAKAGRDLLRAQDHALRELLHSIDVASRLVPHEAHLAERARTCKTEQYCKLAGDAHSAPDRSAVRRVGARLEFP